MLLEWIRSLTLQNKIYEMLLLLEIRAVLCPFLVPDLRLPLSPFAHQGGAGGFAKRLLVSYQTVSCQEEW